MMNMKKIVLALAISFSLGMVGQGFAEEIKNSKIEFSKQSGDEKLAATNWQGTDVVTLVSDPSGKGADKVEVTQLNQGFIGLAKYDAVNNRYEFFDKATKESRADRRVFFVTQDGEKRILISQTKKYQVVVDMEELDSEIFTYSRKGKIDEAGKVGDVFVFHIPYEGKLEFTTTLPVYGKKTGTIDRSRNGRDILSATLWQGTVVLDSNGNDVSAYNGGFLGLARYDNQTNKYEFFDKTTGESRGDFGYYDVIRNNKARATVSLGKKYAAVLELTEINAKKFTYARKGKDAAGNEIDVTVEHVPYKGALKAEFTF